jgi:hypothetical protein
VGKRFSRLQVSLGPLKILQSDLDLRDVRENVRLVPLSRQRVRDREGAVLVVQCGAEIDLHHCTLAEVVKHFRLPSGHVLGLEKLQCL